MFCLSPPLFSSLKGNNALPLNTFVLLKGIYIFAMIIDVLFKKMLLVLSKPLPYSRQNYVLPIKTSVL